MDAVQCLCCCPAERRDDLFDVARALYPHARCVHIESPFEFRQAVIRHGDGQVAAFAGFSSRGISDINLCAAVALDGCAAKTVLVVEAASGSLRSRAKSAGIGRVFELAELGRDAAWESARTPVLRAEGRRDAPSREDDGRKLAPVIVFCSSRGGTGKTSIAAIASLIAASWGMRVALLDLDLANGNLHACFGSKRGGDLAQLGSDDPSAVPGLALRIAEGVELFGPCALPETAETVSPHLGTLYDYVRSSSDLVLADTSSTTTDAVADALQRADRVVLVYDGRVPSLAALSRMGGLAVRLGVARARIMRLENHADPYSKPDFSLGRSEVGLEVARPLRVFEGGREVAQMLGEGLAAELSRYDVDFTRSIGSCLAQILSELGCLPNCEAASRASREPSVKRRFWRFARAGEAG